MSHVYLTTTTEELHFCFCHSTEHTQDVQNIEDILDGLYENE
jgi:hypothetical protein